MAVNFRYSIDSLLSGNAVPLSGGSLYFYTTGTTTPLATYSDDALTIANANPVVLDSQGRHGPIYLQSADYKVVLKDSSGVQVGSTIDPVHGAFAPAGSITNSSTTLASLIAAGVTAATIWITTPQILAADLTIPVGIQLNFIQGGKIKPNGHTCTANCMWNAGPFQTIDLTAGGSVTFASNIIQKNYFFDWWNPAGATDIGALLNTITAATPDYSDTVWMSCGPSGGGTTFNTQTTWQPKNCTSRTWRIAGKRTEETSIVVLNNTGIAGANAVIDMECDGHCLLQGFGVNTGACDYGILIDGQNGVSGGTRISTANRLQWNLVYNSSSRATFKGIAIALTSPANNEFMQLAENYVLSSGALGNYNGAGTGTGIYAGGSSNAHGHLLDHNSVFGCAVGVDAGWTGYRMIGGNFNGNNLDIRINHVSYPTTIEFTDSENGGTFLNIGTVSAGGESPVTIRHARLGTPGGNNTLPVFIFGQYIGTVVIEGVDCQLVSNTPPTLYQINSTCAVGGFIRFQGNNYSNFHTVGGTPNWANMFVFSANGPGPANTVVNIDGDGLLSGLQSYEQVGAAVAPDGSGVITMVAPIQYVTGGGNALQKIALPNWYTNAGVPFLIAVTIIATGADLTITANAAATGVLRSGTLTNGKQALLRYDPNKGAGQWIGTY